MLYITNFLKYSIFVGHSALNSLILSSWFFYKLKKKIWIINIFKTILFLKLALKFLKYLVSNKLPFWFINMEFDKEFIFKKFALECGEYSCTRLWVRGFLSNFKSIQNSITNYILKKAALKNSIKKAFIAEWPITRFTWPRGLFLSNIPLNYVICKEAGTMTLPVVAMVDTNIKSYLFNFPIPSNDDAIDSVCYIISIISKHILLLKYKNVMLWYNKYKIKNIKLLNVLKNLGLKKQIFFKKKQKKFKKYFKMIKVKHFRRFFFKKLINNKNWYHFITSKLFGSFLNFRQNIKLLSTKSISSSKFNNLEFNNVNNVFLYRKLKFLRKLSNRARFYNKHLKRYNYQLTINSKRVLSNTIKLKYLTCFTNKNKKKRNNSKFYFSFMSFMNLIKKIRLFNETFFVNKPSDFEFIRRCHVPIPGQDSDGGYWKYKKDPGEWFEEWGLKYKINEEWKQKWLNNNFNKKLLENNKRQKETYFSDAALPYNIDKWLLPYEYPRALKKWKRKPLNLWLNPFIAKFSIKNKFKHYQSIFFQKEDAFKDIRYHFNWNLPLKSPFSSLHFYSNWFYFLIKEKEHYNDISKYRKRRRKINKYVI